MKRILSAIFAASALSALADAPVVSNVSVVTDPDSPKVEVRYSLSADAVVTVRFVAGGTDIPGEQTIWIGGDVGTKVSAGKPCGYVQTWYGMEELLPAVDGQVVAVTAAQGKTVEKGEIVAFVQ